MLRKFIGASLLIVIATNIAVLTNTGIKIVNNMFDRKEM